MSQATVYQHPRSPYFSAYYLVWDAANQRWKPKSTSTRCTDMADALVVARRLAAVAKAAGPAGRLSREFLVDTVNDILKTSGHVDLEDCPTWKEYAQRWLGLQKTRVKERSLTLFKSRINVFEKWLGKKRADRTLAQFTGDELIKWYSEMLSEGRQPRTVNVMLDTIEAIFERAREEGFMKRNPAALILREANNDSVREDFSQEELQTLIKFLEANEKKENYADWLTAVLFGICTAQRFTDCTNVQFTQISDTTPFNIWTLTQKKTGTKVEIPIVGRLAERLKALRKKPLKSLFVMPTLANRDAGGTGGLSEDFTAILTAAGIDSGVVAAKGKAGATRRAKTFHSLRHSTNSILANANVPKDVRKAILGHMTDKHNDSYTHIKITTSGPALEEALKKLG